MFDWILNAPLTQVNTYFKSTIKTTLIMILNLFKAKNVRKACEKGVNNWLSDVILIWCFFLWLRAWVCLFHTSMKHRLLIDQPVTINETAFKDFQERPYLKVVFRKFYFLHSWILCLKYISNSSAMKSVKIKVSVIVRDHLQITLEI